MKINYPLITFLLLFFLTYTSWAGVPGETTNCRNYVSVRSGPGGGYKAIGRLSCKIKVRIEVISERSGYYKIRYQGGTVGHVPKKYIKTEGLLNAGEVLAEVGNAGLSPQCDTCENERSSTPTISDGLCNYPELGEKWVNNCNKLYRSGIPKDALEYTLRAFKHNYDKFRNKNCYRVRPSGHYSMGGLTKKKINEKMKNGIPNKCQMIINNTKEKLSAHRGRMYFIDICKGKVIKDYFNLGTGPLYKNVSGKHSTVKGAFLTGTSTFDFQPGPKSVPAYIKLRAQMKRKHGVHKAHALQLFGLQKTNNGSAPDGKYIHVSPYKSSWGCPSVKMDNYWMLDQLAKKGPSLVVNYANNMPSIEDVNSCGRR